jgi:hypothetical protein
LRSSSPTAAAGYAYSPHAAGLLAPQDADALRMFTAFTFAARLVLGWRARDGSAVLLGQRTVSDRRRRSRSCSSSCGSSRRLWVGAGFSPWAWATAPDRRRGVFQRSPRRDTARWLQWTRHAVGVVLIAVLAGTFITATLRILRHVGTDSSPARTPAATIADDDLVVESRNASDVHVLALPLAYTYARNVLVLPRTDPNRGLRRISIGTRARTLSSSAAEAPSCSHGRRRRGHYRELPDSRA